ncbi:MAG: ribonuclease P protein component [Pseudomonadota bacterium]
MSELSVLTKRSDFLAAARGKSQGTPGFHLQARERSEGEESSTPIRVGFTCSKKVGNAVARNRAKRRLREAAAIILTEQGRPGWDYVLIGRRDATDQRNWQDLLEDLRRGLGQIHGA